MNDFSYEQIELGQEAHFEATVTDAMMDAFKAISADTNPLHCDEAYAVARGFEGRVVYGMLTAAFYSRLAGVYLPGKQSLIYGIDVSFHKPVYVGMRLTVTGTVREKNDVFRMLAVKASITDERGEKLSKATIKIGFA